MVGVWQIAQFLKIIYLEVDGRKVINTSAGRASLLLQFILQYR
jgi:hypothetical protein